MEESCQEISQKKVSRNDEKRLCDSLVSCYSLGMSSTSTAVAEFKKSFARTVSALEKELEIVIAESIKASRAFAREEITRAFTSEVVKEYYPHEEMSASEVKEEIETWAENALEESLNSLSLLFIKARIMKESQK